PGVLCSFPTRRSSDLLSVFTASIFTLWLMIQSIWSFSRVALAIVVMSLGVSAMHYTSSLRANFERTEITPITESSHATYDLLFADRKSTRLNSSHVKI